MKGFDPSPLAERDFVITAFRALHNYRGTPLVSASELVCRGGQRTSDRFFYIDRGRAAFLQNGRKVLEAGPHELVYLPDDVEYLLRWVECGDELINSYVIGFKLLDALTFRQLVLADGIASIADDPSRSYRGLFAETCSLCESLETGGRVKGQSLLLGLIHRLLTENRRLTADGEKIIPEVRDAVRYIEEHCTERLDIDYLVEMCHVSPSTFRRQFLLVAKEPPIRYLNRMKLKQAYALLLDGEMNVTEVAAAVNIPDPAYFSRLFKEAYGVSPRGIRH